MKKIDKALICLLVAILFGKTVSAGPDLKNTKKATAPLSFIENKGQVVDQNLAPRNDIQFSVKAASGLNIFIGGGAIHYQFSKKNDAGEQSNGTDLPGLATKVNGAIRSKIKTKGSGAYIMDRMDVELVGANKNAQVITDLVQAYHENYFTTAANHGKAGKASSYNKITYKDIYPNIDWVLYVKDGHLEHEFVVREGGNVSDIQLKYGGAKGLKINAGGSLEATTPQGAITEKAPTSFGGEGQPVATSFVLNGAILSYKTEPFAGELTIDPSLVWATYFGGSSEDEDAFVQRDPSGNVIMAGYTSSTSAIATSGAYQTTFGGGYDAFLAQFNSSGVLQWATYYGGSDTDQALGLAVDPFGDIFICGQTKSPDGIATLGAYQTFEAGDYDGFLAEFDNSGNLQWGTYFGGPGFDQSVGVATDADGNVYVTGTTVSSSGIATVGAYQAFLAGSQNAFIASFDGFGDILWATYYGGDGTDIGNCIAVNGANLYITGPTSSISGIATSGAHQPINAGGTFDGFLASFSTTGALQWGTFYGGSGDDEPGGVATDPSGNVVLDGITNSLGTIASTGAYQAALAGGYDAFVAKFSSTGAIQWGTYYGGTGYDGAGTIATDGSGNIYVDGSTSSTTAIASSGAMQPAYGGGIYDAFMAEFSPAGSRTYGTYFGSTGDDEGGGIVADGAGNAYIGGLTTSTSGIATTGAYQTTYGGGSADAYLAEINVCTFPVVAAITGTATVCSGATTNLHDATSGGTWSSASAGVAAIGTTGIVTGVGGGTALISYTVTNGCGSSAATQFVTVNGTPTPVIITPSVTATVCIGSGTSFTASSSVQNTLIYQDFNSGMTGETGGAWTTVNTGSSTVYNWGIYPSGSFTDVPSYTGGIALTGDGSNFMGSDPDLAGGSVNVNTILYSPSFSTVGYPAAVLTYNYFLTSQAPYDVAMEVDYSIDGGATWFLLTNYAATTSTVINLGSESWTAATPNATTALPPAAIGQPNVILRWNYHSDFGYWWAIDNVKVAGSTPVSSFTWAGIAGATGLSCTSCGTTSITPTASGSNVYSVTATASGCSSSSGVTVSVNPLPAAPAPITGTTSLCVGSATTLHDVIPLGTWSSTAPGVAIIGSSTGNVTAIGVGTTTISYTVTNSCGSTAATINVTVVAAPGPILGTLSACVGATSLLSDGGGGTWSSSAPGTASIGTTGLVTGNGPGNATITYSLGGTCTTTAIFTVNANPAAITPPAAVTVCVGSSTSLGDVTPAGVWSSSAPGTATVGTSGSVTGVAVGTVNILYTVGGCAATKPVTVVATPAPLSPVSASVCVGSTVTFTESTGGGAWSSVAPGTASVVGGTVTGVAAGTTSISYTVGTCAVGAPVTVNAGPSAITPPGAVTLCVGATASLGDVTPGGTWSSATPGIATVGTSGTVTGVTAGTVNILYTNGSGCAATKSVTVLITPAALSPASATVCPGSTAVFTETVGGGAWSSVAPGTATIVGGTVTGVAAGTTSVSYTIGACAVGAPVTVNAAPSAITPAGVINVCVGATTSLGDPTPAGTWSSASPGVATVGTSGTVTGISVGTANISYTNGLGCAAVKPVNVLATPAPLSPVSATVCTGFTVAFTETVGGGLWSSTAPGTASVAGGVVTGVTVGTASISYTIGTCAVGAPVTVNLSPSAGVITGPAVICVGSVTTYTDASAGGMWSSSNPAVATVGTGGAVTAVGGGTFTLSYAVTNGCGTATATQVITVNATATAGTIVGTPLVCAGGFTILVDTTAGGVWSASNSNATISGTGLLVGVTPGIDTISYSVTNSCGTVAATFDVTVGLSLSPGTISGLSSVCAGSSITLTDPAIGGAWSSSNSSASVSGSGIVTGATGGTDTISYTVTSGCGSVAATHVVTVVPIPAAGTIVGPIIVCAGTITTYTDATTGGIWGITNSDAAISGAGIVTALSIGTDTITYTVSNMCGTSIAESAVSIGAAITAGSISGPGAVCQGAAISLTDPVSGGVWSASNTNATVIAGVATGVSAGVDTIYYTVTGSCGSVVASATIVVNALPVAGAVSGPSTLCIGGPATYTDPALGGAWSVSNSHAGITSGGLVTPFTVGTDTIYYSVSNTCGTSSASAVVSIMGALTAGTITGPGAVCAGSSLTLADGMPGGIWAASNANATVSGGVVSGINPGADTISYTVTGTCGSASATKVVTISTAPVAGAITGPTAVCAGSPVSLADAAPGGVWSASNPSATVSIGGLVTAITSGTDTISYTVTNGCGSAAATQVMVVSTALPSAGSITGPVTVCAASAITLSDAVPGGVWNSSNANATVSGGVVTGVTPGLDTITYMVTNACGSATATADITVGAALVAGTVSGPGAVCVGSSVTLSDAAPGGTWSSSNTDATVSGGVVTGVSAGTSTISYTVTGSCGMAAATLDVVVSIAPDAGTITGPTSLCAGAAITLSDAAAGGAWSAANARATVTGGVVTGILAGLDTIRYSVTNACGTAVTSWPISISGSPSAGSISGSSSVCPGATAALVHSATGGVWSSSNSGLASVNSSGLVTGIAAGTLTISYTLTNGCGHSSALHPMTVLSLGLCEGSHTLVGGPGANAGDELIVVPNPNNGVFTMKLSSAIAGPVHVVITNLIGQKVKEFTTATNTEVELHMGEAAGIYLLNASSVSGNYVVKVVIN